MNRCSCSVVPCKLSHSPSTALELEVRKFLEPAVSHMLYQTVHRHSCLALKQVVDLQPTSP
jgi:hypothetical protein